MRSIESTVATSILKAIHDEPEGNPAMWADTAWTDEDEVIRAIAVWLENGVLYWHYGNLYLSEDGRRSIGLYVRPVKAVA